MDKNKKFKIITTVIVIALVIAIIPISVTSYNKKHGISNDKKVEASVNKDGTSEASNNEDGKDAATADNADANAEETSENKEDADNKDADSEEKKDDADGEDKEDSENADFEDADSEDNESDDNDSSYEEYSKRYIGKKTYGPEMFEYKDGEVPMFSEKYINYKGKKYVRNSAVKSYILLGIDRKGGFKKKYVNYTAGQADGIFVLAHNTANGTVKLIQVHRDSMAPVPITDGYGHVDHRELSQITVSFGFGDGNIMSVEYMAKSLSDLFDGFKFDGYLAGTLENIVTLNDYLGGVSIKITEDNLEKLDPALVKGKTVLLKGPTAEAYVRKRDTSVDKTAYTRLARQRRYLGAFNQKVKEEMKTDNQIVAKMFTRIEDNMMTNLRKDQYVKIGMDLAKEGNVTNKIITIPGYLSTAQKYEEYYPNMEKLHDIVVNTFYRPVN